MSVLKYFKNIPRSPSHRATGPMCNFFFQICNEVPGEKKRGGPVAPQRATDPCRPPQGRQAPIARGGGGDRVPSQYISPGCHMPPSPLSFEPKNSGKKRGVRRREAAKLCRIPHL